MAKARYDVLGKLHCDGERYEPGDQIMLEAKDAKVLLEGGVIAKPKTKAAKAPEK